MNKQALVKLAQVRLAINYVLRNRMAKQADVSSLREPERPFDVAANLRGQQNFFNRYEAGPTNLERKVTTFDLSPRSISNSKSNPFLRDINVPYMFSPKDKLRIKLFGLPTISSSRFEDTANIREYAQRVSDWKNDMAFKYKDYFEDPLINNAFSSLGFNRNDEAPWGFDPIRFNLSYGHRKAQDRSYTGTRAPFPYHIDPGTIINKGKISTDAEGSYLPLTAYPDRVENNEYPYRLDYPLNQEQKEALEAMFNSREKDQMISDDMENDEEYYRGLVDNNYTDAYRQYRNNLIHSYINQSNVGKAFRAYPSLATGIPYAAYHALPYMDEGNRPDSVNQGINSAINGYRNLMKGKK